MKNNFEILEYDEESDNILDIIENFEKQGITTNVDFVKAEEERVIILSKESNEVLNENMGKEVIVEEVVEKTAEDNDELLEKLEQDESIKLTKEEIKVLKDFNNRQDVFDLVM